MFSKSLNNSNKSIIQNKSHNNLLYKYNNLKMSLLDKAKIGNSAQVNLKLSNDRFTKEIIDAINVSSIGKISDFRITDGKGIGVVLELSNGKKQWFFEHEIDLLDENGDVIKKIHNTKDSKNLVYNFFKELNYQNKNKFSELINPINFLIWLIVSLKNIFQIIKNFSKLYMI